MQRHYEDDPTLLGPILQARFEAHEKHIDERFAALEKHIDQRFAYIGAQIDGLEALERRRCELIEERLLEHEKRIAAQERQGWLRWAATIGSAILAFVGIRTPGE